MSKIFAGLCTLFLIIVFTPVLTRADPFVVTDGTITVTGLTGGPLGNLTGDNFAVGIGGSGTGSFAPQRCAPCLPGSTMEVTGLFASSNIGHGTFNINGTMFTNVGLAGLLLLNGGTIVVPSVMSDVTITVPFTFTANLTACPVDCFFGPTLFTVQLVGSGTGTLDLTFFRLSNGQPIFQFKTATFQFEEVPEPASILLFGGGFALLTAKLRCRLSSRNDGGI